MVCLAKAASHCPWLPLVPWSLAPGRRSLWRQPPKPSVSRKTTWYSPERFLAAHKIVETSLTESEGNCTANLRYLTVFCTFQAALHPPYFSHSTRTWCSSCPAFSEKRQDWVQEGRAYSICYIEGNRSPKRNESRDCRREVPTTGRDHGPLTRPGRLPVGPPTDLRQRQGRRAQGRAQADHWPARRGAARAAGAGGSPADRLQGRRRRLRLGERRAGARQAPRGLGRVCPRA